MLRSMMMTLAFVGLATNAALAQTEGPATAPAEPAVTRTSFGDWTRVCMDATGQCILEQVGKTDKGENALYFQVQKLPEPKTVDGVRIESMALIRVPLGVVLTNQLRLQIDQGEVASSPFLTCSNQGCIVQAPLRPEQLESFRRGAKATFGYTLIQGDKAGDISATVSLSGFTRGYEGL